LNNGSWNNNNKTNTNICVLAAYELCKMEYVSYGEIEDAWMECRKHKQNTQSCIDFEMELFYNLQTLQYELNNKTYVIGYSICFVVEYPKYREVFAADFRDRIVHHLLCRKFHEIFEDYQIDSSYACRKGKGIQAAVRALSSSVQENPDLWVWQGDIQSDFMTIDKRVMWRRLEKLIRWKYEGEDIEWWIWLWKMVVFHEPQKRCVVRSREEMWELLPKNKSLFTCEEYKGLAIGNLSSQHLNNILLTDLDYFICGFEGVMGYGRYADDFWVIGDRETLKYIMPMARKYIKDVLNMTLHPDKWHLDAVGKGIKFAGYVCKQGRIYAGNRLVANAFGKMETEPKLETLAIKANSYLGFIGWCDSYAIRRNLASMIWERAGRRVSFTNNFRKLSIILKEKNYEWLQNTVPETGIRAGEEPAMGLLG